MLKTYQNEVISERNPLPTSFGQLPGTPSEKGAAAVPLPPPRVFISQMPRLPHHPSSPMLMQEYAMSCQRMQGLPRGMLNKSSSHDNLSSHRSSSLKSYNSGPKPSPLARNPTNIPLRRKLSSKKDEKKKSFEKLAALPKTPSKRVEEDCKKRVTFVQKAMIIGEPDEGEAETERERIEVKGGEVKESRQPSPALMNQGAIKKMAGVSMAVVGKEKISARNTCEYSNITPSLPRAPLDPSNHRFGEAQNSVRKAVQASPLQTPGKSKPTSPLPPLPASSESIKPSPPAVERDQYGFKKVSPFVSLAAYNEFQEQYLPVLEKRQKKWEAMMHEAGGRFPLRSAKTKRLIRKGIPSSFRGKAWLYYSGAEAKLAQNPGLYEKLVCEAQALGNKNESAEIIERDLHRTFPENLYFQSTPDGKDAPFIGALRRILLAFSVHVPSIGYCQSLNYIAGLMLLFLDREEEVFWLLTVTVLDHMPEKMYDVTMEGVNVDQDVLLLLLSEHSPAIWNKISGGKTFWQLKEAPSAPFGLVTCNWFLTLYISSLPIETVLRVWDCFFYEGQKILFRIALTILQLNEKEITAVEEDPLEIFKAMQNAPKRMIDCQRLMDTCFTRPFPPIDLTRRKIERLRKEVRTRNIQRKKEGRSRTNTQ
ncbi:uncharacterized protein VTP21DRAFT_1983 [Calcarisporiella thermophila]|uniref:uncharacterized protein n=1 Tax=Calcarisporiella thermophila TaxID=911321 RepID=UPI003742183A